MSVYKNANNCCTQKAKPALLIHNLIAHFKHFYKVTLTLEYICMYIDIYLGHLMISLFLHTPAL